MKRLMDVVDLQVAEKVSPDAYTMDGDSWFPVVRATHARVPSDGKNRSEAVVEKKRLVSGQGTE
jgi:hypothetical protein